MDPSIWYMHILEMDIIFRKTEKIHFIFKVQVESNWMEKKDTMQTVVWSGYINMRESILRQKCH